MTHASKSTARDTRDVRGTLGALVFIGVGIVGWWNISGAPSSQGVVFPKTVIGLMIVFSGLLILRNLLGYGVAEAGGAPGSVLRRAALLAAMIAATLAMPYLGFVVAALAAYLAIMAIAMYERWTLARLVVYPALGVVVVAGFFLIFQRVFQVPLPESDLLNGLL